MPNWVTSKLTISGPDANEIMKNLLSTDESNNIHFDFNKIVPMPESLHIVSGSLTDRAIEIYLSHINPNNHEFKYEKVGKTEFNDILDLFNNSKLFTTYSGNLSKEQVNKLIENMKEEKLQTVEDFINYAKRALNNIKQHGAMDWYDWSIRNWGTKWNACHTFYDENTPNVIHFDTAWNDVRGLIAFLSRKFPENQFEYQFAEEQIGLYTGSVCFKNGEILYGAFFEDGSKEAYELAFELWGEDLKENFIFDENKKTYVYKDEFKTQDEGEME